jgi:hypothetical protein
MLLDAGCCGKFSSPEAKNFPQFLNEDSRLHSKNLMAASRRLASKVVSSFKLDTALQLQQRQ